MDRFPEGDGRYRYDSVPVKRENIGRPSDKGFPPSYTPLHPKEGYHRGDYPHKSRWDSAGPYDDRQSHRREFLEFRDYPYSKEAAKRSRDYPRDSPESSKSRHRSHSRKRHHGGGQRSESHEPLIKREPLRYEPTKGPPPEPSEPISKKIYHKNREIAKVSPWPQRARVKRETDDGIEILEISDNKTRTRLRRMNKNVGVSEKVCEVVTVPSDSPKATPPHLSQSEPQNPWTPRISVVSGARLAMKFEEEVMIPEEEVSRNLSETMSVSAPAEAFHERQEENVPYEESGGIPVANYEEVECKPFQGNPFVPSVVQMETAPIAKEVEQSYNRTASCSRCNIRLIHECKYPESTDPRCSTLCPGQITKCQCSLIFLHTRDCADSIDKVYVQPLKESGLLKQVDRIHVYECHDCTFKFSLQGVKSGSHYFESLTRKDGQLRERVKRYMCDLKPLLKHIDGISRQRYPHEPPSVQEKHVEIRRCLVCQCNQGCCIVYHECPPKPVSGEEEA